MEISKKLDYALCMLKDAARAADGEVVSVRQVADRNGVPYSFARTIQHELVKGGLLETVRGPHGGMRMAVDPVDTTLLDIVEVVEGPLRVAGEGSEGRSAACGEGFDPLWVEFDRLLRVYLSSVTLQQLVVEGMLPVIPDELRFELKYLSDMTSQS